MGRKITFIVSSETSIGVLQSQVFAKANYIGKITNSKTRVILVGKEINTISVANQFANIEIQYLGKDVQVNDIKKSIIYIRGIDLFLKNYLIFKVNRNKLVYDFRAFLFAESFGRHKSHLKLIVVFLMELLVYSLADKVCAVSHELKKRLHSYFLIKRDVFVFPCLGFNDLKMYLPAEKNNESIDFVYLGGLSEWQKFDRILEHYKRISTVITNTTFTIITKNKDEAQQRALKENIKCTVMSLQNHEVFKELTKYNFGFLIRENNLINNVASPIKFLEYLIGGVIPIMTEGIGDYSNEAKTNEIGYVINYEDQIEEKEIYRILNDSKKQQRIIDYLSSYDYKKRIEQHPLITLHKL